MAGAIEVREVRKRYHRTEALRGVTFDVPRGEMFGLIGPDGAGKTTTIRLLCGLIRPDTGAITVLGHDPVGHHRAITRSVGYLSQRFSLYGDLSVDENMAFVAAIHGVTDYHRTRDRLLDITQLTPFRARLADRLSGGMKQKLALACTLVHEPAIILLDEPTTGVDPVSRREFWKLLSQFVDQGLTILMSTPYLDEAERCHRVAMLHDGQVLAVDEPGRLRQSVPGCWFEVVLDSPRNSLSRVQRVAAGLRVFGFGDRLHAWLPERQSEAARRHLDQVLADAGVASAVIRPIQPSLEDVFVFQLSERVTP